jgi:RNA polymerase sigma-70 factor (ECF subfamily)
MSDLEPEHDFVWPTVNKSDSYTVPIEKEIVQAPAQVYSKIVPVKTFASKDMADINAVNDILTGKTNSFSVIYERYYEKVNRDFMLALHKNQDIADDLTMEFFTKIYHKIHQYKPENTFNAWITRAAKNHLIDYTRRIKASPVMVSLDRGPVNNDGNEITNNSGDKIAMALKDDSSLNGAEILMDIEKKNALNRAIMMLDKKSRQIIRMWFVENKTYKEIVDETGLSVSNVKVKILRAKVRLKEILLQNKGLLAAVS